MSKVQFKFPCGIQAVCKTTGFAGTITNASQQINGSIQYALQPRIKEAGSFVPDGLIIDEEDIEPDILADSYAPYEVDFVFETGDRVRNRTNGFEGVITRRIHHKNACEGYRIEGALTKEGKEVNHPAFVQELELIDKGLNKKDEKPVARARTGGPSIRQRLIERA